MSQVFAADGVSSTASGTTQVSTITTIITGNFVNPPFGNAKTLVSGMVAIIPGTGSTGIYVTLWRNPQAENVSLIPSTLLSVTAGNSYVITVQGVDIIPDGRPVQYALKVTQAGASVGATWGNAAIQALLISG